MLKLSSKDAFVLYVVYLLVTVLLINEIGVHGKKIVSVFV